jgi:hypothetical protein
LPGRDGCHVALIWASGKQKYFRFARIFRLTRIPKIRIDLPVGQFRAPLRSRAKGTVTGQPAATTLNQVVPRSQGTPLCEWVSDTTVGFCHV